MADSASRLHPAPADTASTVSNQTALSVSALRDVISNKEAEQQLDTLTKLFHQRTQTSSGLGPGRKICVLYNELLGKIAQDVGGQFANRQIGVEHIAYDKNPKWFESARKSESTHFLFFGLPPFERLKKKRLKSAKSPIDTAGVEYEFFAPSPPYRDTDLKVNNVVVVLRDPLTTRKDYHAQFKGHYLARYMVLNTRQPPQVIAASTLGVFAGEEQ